MINTSTVIKNKTIAQAGTILAHVNVTRLISSSLTLTVACSHTGGTITITLKWSPDGVNFITQAAAAVGDVSAIASGNLAWDNFVLPGIPQVVEITITEDNVAAVTDLDLVILGY